MTSVMALVTASVALVTNRRKLAGLEDERQTSHQTVASYTHSSKEPGLWWRNL